MANPILSTPKQVEKITANPTVQATAAATAAAAIDDIVAAPLITPNFTNVRPKNPSAISLRWVLHTLYKQDGTQSVLRYEQAKTQGYTPACREDLVNPPEAFAVDGGRRYVNGDLVLMKISRRAYEGALLYKDQQAAKQIMAVNQKSRIDAQQSILAGTNDPVAATKVSVFNPTQGELQAFVDSDPDKEASPLGGK